MQEEHIVEICVRDEADIVRARQAARLLGSASGLGEDGVERLSAMAAEAARYVFADCQPAYLRFWLGQPLRERHALGLEVSCRRRDGQILTQESNCLAPTLFEALGGTDHHTIAQAGEDTVITLHQWLPADRLLHRASLEALRLEFGMTVRSATTAAVHLQNQGLLGQLRALQQEEIHMEGADAASPEAGAEDLYRQLGTQAGELARLSATDTSFLSSVGHELRGPLSSIYALSRLLLARTDGELTAEQETQARLIHEASGELLTLIDDLADLARIEAGTLVLRLGEFDLGELYRGLSGAFDVLGPKPRVQLSFEAPEAGLAVYSDRHKVAQILRNLIVNALKFTLEGSVRVTCSANDECIRMAVADTGIGIAAADLDVIFQESVRLHGPHDDVPGAGLGLALSRRLAEAIDGRIEVQSAPGTGSVFALTIPRRYAPAEDGRGSFDPGAGR